MASEIRFEWDPRKAQSNLRKHGIDFETAARVFDDTHVYEYEEGIVHGEARFRSVGEVAGKLVFVSYTSYTKGEEEVVRIISARPASPRESRAYQRHSQNDR